LRARKTLRRHRNPRVGNPWEKWLPSVGKTSKGKKPQGRQLSKRGESERRNHGNGDRVVKLCRGVKG
jgi:hypothetical protein